MLSGYTSMKCGLVIMQSKGPASLGAFGVHCFRKWVSLQKPYRLAVSQVTLIYVKLAILRSESPHMYILWNTTKRYKC